MQDSKDVLFDDKKQIWSELNDFEVIRQQKLPDKCVDN